MKNTKWQLKILESHSKSNVIDIDDIYSTCSRYKRQAYQHCWDEYSHRSPVSQNYITTAFRIISYNKMMFTCGYYFWKGNMKLYFKYFSHRRTVEFEVFDHSYIRNC